MLDLLAKSGELDQNMQTHFYFCQTKFVVLVGKKNADELEIEQGDTKRHRKAGQEVDTPLTY